MSRTLGGVVAVLVLTSVWLGSGMAARAQDVPAVWPVKRMILALYDSRRERLPHTTRIHRFAEMPLNHLGFVLDYRDVNALLPGPAEVTLYRGVLTWFVEPLRRPDSVIEWLEMATDAGLKHVVLGEITPPEPEGHALTVNSLLGRMGLQYTGRYVDVTFKARIASLDKEIAGFERPIDKAIPDFPIVPAIPGAANVHLSLQVPDRNAVLSTAVVATGKGGGFAAQNFTIHYEPNTDRVSWVINPFAFFRLAFGADVFPIPDTTTVSGRRIYFSHIDGDGWNNLTELEGLRQREMSSAEVVARELIEPYPELPVTVGLIAGDIDIGLGGNPEGATTASRLFALPHVEVASHTYTHPYNWQFFESYDRKAEQDKIADFQRPDQPMRERVTTAMLKLAGKSQPADRFDRYVAGSDDLPRTYLREPFDLGKEVQGALTISESLAPRGKPARLYMWSGDTTPFPAAIAATRKAGVRNLNGGDSRFDREYPSIAYVPPISRLAGGERQIYAANSNENTYTNDWTGPYFGYLMLEHTLRNTDLPRRLKPFNVYYHMYSGEKPSALAAVRHFLEMARTGRYAPIPASHYATIADDFFGVEINRVGDGAWTVHNRGALQTVRFDAATALDIDLERSKGVLGSSRHADALYVALDPAVTSALVVVQPLRPAHVAGAAGPFASLLESRWRLSELVLEACAVSVKAEGFGPGEMLWRTAPERSIRVTVRATGQEVFRDVYKSDKEGRLAFTVPSAALQGLDMRLECHD